MTSKTSKTSEKKADKTEEETPKKVEVESAAKVLQEKVEEKAEEEKEVKLPDTNATKLWLRIKELPIDLFALPEQTVEMYCRYVPIDPEKVFVLIKSSAVLPALEQALYRLKLGPNEIWDIEQAAPYTVISTKSKLPFSVPRV
jgi:hypothetical protein